MIEFVKANSLLIRPSCSYVQRYIDKRPQLHPLSVNHTATQSQQQSQTLSAPDIDARVKALGLTLPPVPTPAGLYKPAVVSGNRLYISGHGPMHADGSFVRGRVGEDMTVDQAKEAGRLAALAALSSMKQALGGSLNRVRRIVKTLGMVNISSSKQGLETVHVVNGFSEVMRDVFGPDAGIGARSAVGMATLPMGIPVEVEAVFELWPQTRSRL